jgi:DNA-binding transcriptional ArsR family regulator
MQTRRDVFQAIADPTRRQIINLIADQPKNLNTIADNFNVTRPAISQHIKILLECGLVEVKRQGRENFCEAKLTELREVFDWVDQYRQAWTESMEKPDDTPAEIKADSKKHAKKKKDKDKKKKKDKK